MNWIDLVILGVFAFYLAEGLRRGFIEQTLELVGFFLTIFLSFATYRPFAVWLGERTGIEGPAAQPLAFLVLWVIFQILYSFLLQLAYPMIPTRFRLNPSNRFAGVVPAFLKAFIFLAVLLTLVISFPVPPKLKSEIESSSLGSRFIAQSGTVESYLSRILGQDIKETLTFLTVPAQTEEIIPPDERVMLKFTYDDGTVDGPAEQKMLGLINQERVKAGLKPLVWNEQLAEVARSHSRDMFERGYFSHQNLDGLSPFDRMQRAGITFRVAGENIAYAATVDLAHGGLMRSPGHRANILEANFGSVGLGVIDGGVYGRMFTQNFKD
jgi:uncharacterized protein YkwD